MALQLTPCLARAAPQQDFDPGRPAALCLSSLCRFNLHHLLCVLGWQVKYRGLTVEHLEVWGEREMGGKARATRGKITGKPEVLVIQLDLDERALQRVALELGVEGGSEWGGSTSSSGVAGASAPAALVHGGSGGGGGPAAAGATGKGVPPTDSEWAEIEVRGGLGRALGGCALGTPYALRGMDWRDAGRQGCACVL